MSLNDVNCLENQTYQSPCELNINCVCGMKDLTFNRFQRKSLRLLDRFLPRTKPQVFFRDTYVAFTNSWKVAAHYLAYPTVCKDFDTVANKKIQSTIKASLIRGGIKFYDSLLSKKRGYAGTRSDTIYVKYPAGTIGHAEGEHVKRSDGSLMTSEVTRTNAAGTPVLVQPYIIPDSPFMTMRHISDTHRRNMGLVDVLSLIPKDLEKKFNKGF
jgi:hypothetical protein